MAYSRECVSRGVDKVLMVCDKGNIGSAKSILGNGGVREDGRVIDGKTVQRYWIDLTEKPSKVC